MFMRHFAVLSDTQPSVGTSNRHYLRESLAMNGDITLSSSGVKMLFNVDEKSRIALVLSNNWSSILYFFNTRGTNLMCYLQCSIRNPIRKTVDT
jgi:hypothetical protein